MSDIKVRIAHGDKVFRAAGDAGLVTTLYGRFLDAIGAERVTVAGRDRSLEEQIAGLDPGALAFLSEQVTKRLGAAPAVADAVPVAALPAKERKKRDMPPKVPLTDDLRSHAQRLYEQRIPVLAIGEVARRSGLGVAQLVGLAMSNHWINPRKTLAESADPAPEDHTRDDEPEPIDGRSRSFGGDSQEDEESFSSTSRESSESLHHSSTGSKVWDNGDET